MLLNKSQLHGTSVVLSIFGGISLAVTSKRLILHCNPPRISLPGSPCPDSLDYFLAAITIALFALATILLIISRNKIR